MCRLKSYIPTAISTMCRQVDRPEHLQVILLIEEPLPLAVIYCSHNVGKGPVYLVNFRNFSKLVPLPLVPCKDFPSWIEYLNLEKIAVQQDVQI